MTDLARLRPLVEIMAAERTKDRPDLFDDAVQEGLIAAWQALERRPDKPDVYYTIAARNGVLNPLRGRTSFGAEAHRGSQDAHGFTEPLTTAVDGVEVLVVDEADPAASEAYLRVEFDDVRAAVADLDAEDRALVYGRYWSDEGFKALGALLGRPAGTLSRRWTEIIRPTLRKRLS